MADQKNPFTGDSNPSNSKQSKVTTGTAERSSAKQNVNVGQGDEQVRPGHQTEAGSPRPAEGDFAGSDKRR